MKKKVCFFLMVLALFCLIFVGCGSSSGDKSYKLSEGNHVLLGPLENADVKICELAYSNDYKCVDVKTDKFGKFSFNNSENWDGNQIVLVVVSGGQDIDANDDGVLDDNKIPNHGILHGFAKVSDLVDGKVNITVLSDIVYQYVSHLCSETTCTLSATDLENAIETISNKLIATTSTASINKAATRKYFDTILKFNPLAINDTPLAIDKSIISELAKMFHLSDIDPYKEKVRNTITSVFREKGLVLDNSALLNLKKEFKLSLLQPANATIQVFKNNTSIQISDILWHNPAKETQTSFKFSASILDNDKYELVKWMGCDTVSDDGNSCFVNDIKEDKIIAPIVLPKPKLAQNIKIIDITGCKVTLTQMPNDVNIYDLDVTSPYFDELKIETDNNTLLTKLTNLKPGDIITNQVEPVFFREVVGVTKSQVTITNPFPVFTITTTFKPLEDIIPRGYISSAMTTQSASSYETIQPIRPARSYFTINNKNIIPFDSQTQVVKLTFKNGKIQNVRLSDLDFSWETTVQDNFTESLTDDGKTEISGTLTLRPYVELSIGWDIDLGWDDVKFKLDGAYFTMGSDIEIEGVFTSEMKAKYSKHITITDAIQYHQVFSVYGIPIKVTMKLPITCGIKGAGKGSDYDKAAIVGKVSYNYSVLSNPHFEFLYDGKQAISNLSNNFSFNQTSEINIGANAFAYVGVEPGIYVYGVGAAMKNYVGPYLKLDLKAQQSASGETSLSLDDLINGTTVNAQINIEGEIGVGYYGRIVASTEKENNISKKVVEKINDAIRGKYTEFWQPWPLYSVSKTFDNNNEFGIMAIPGELQVKGQRFITINSVGGDANGGRYSYNYELENIGDEDIDWEVVHDYTDSDVTIQVSPQSGTLQKRSKTNVTVTITPNISLGQRNYYSHKNFNINFKQKFNVSSSKITKASTFNMVPLLLNTDLTMADSVTKFTSKTNIYTTRKLSWTPNLTISLKQIPGYLPMLNFSWDIPTSTTFIDGYTILYDNRGCSKLDKFYANVEGKNGYLGFPLNNPSNETFCFKVYGYKKIDLFNKLYFTTDDQTAFANLQL